MTIAVPLETLEPGMILAEPVFNQFGQLLIPKGAQLSSRHVKVFKTWGIHRITVEGGESVEEIPVIDEEIQNRARDRVNKRLFWQPNNPLEEEIIHLAVQQAVQRSRHQGLKGPSSLDVF